MSSVLKNIFVFIGLLLICALGYYLYVQRGDSLLSHDKDDSLSQSMQATQEAEILLRQLNEIKSIQIDDEFFTDPRFTTLIDNTTQVQSYNIGRPTPFESTLSN